MNTDKYNVDIINQVLALPSDAQLSINRCNLPAAVLGSVQFQRHPTRLLIDGISELHANLFAILDGIDSAHERARRFMDYMVVQFRLHQLEDVGLDEKTGYKRVNADYLRLLRGWLFDPNGREAAVLKAWVESRFGLLARYHHGPLNNKQNYQAYLIARSNGLLGTNALEAQLDLLYSYCQYELARHYSHRQQPTTQHLTLYRGVNRLNSYDILHQADKQHAVVLLNNLNAFTSNRERADEFGDALLQVEVPLPKLFYYSKLLPGILKGEDEYIVIGGVYEVRIERW